MKVQARAFINAAEAGYQTMQEQAQPQFMEMGGVRPFPLAM